MEIKLNRSQIQSIKETLEEWYRDLEYSKDHIGRGCVFDPSADAVRIIKANNKLEGANMMLSCIGLFAYHDGETLHLTDAVTSEEL